MPRLIAGHTTRVEWKPDPEAMAAFIQRLKSL